MIDILAIPFWAWYLLGMGVGGWIVYFICSKRKDGVIHVTRGDARDYYLFEFNIPPEEVPSMRQVVFVVKIEPGEQKIQSP